MRRLLVDANIFLEFFRFSKDDLDELRKVAELIRTAQLELYLTQQIRDEVLRNRERVLVQTFKSVGDNKIPSMFPQVLRNYERFATLDQARQAFAREVDGLLTRARQDASERRLPADHLLGELMGLATDLPVTEATIAAAKNRFDRGNPPGKDRSYGDAITWEAVLKHHPQFAPLDIITADGDYRSPLRPNGLHEFLQSEWDRSKSSEVTVYDTLTSFLRTHFPSIRISTEVASEVAVVRLETSGSFASTHQAIADLAKLGDFTPGQVQRLIDAALTNGQVGAIIRDPDVAEFYSWLMGTLGDDADPSSVKDLQNFIRDSF